MQRTFRILTAMLAALGLAFAASSAMAQKAEAPKAAAKKTEAPAKKAEPVKADAKKADAKSAAILDINTASAKELATLKGVGDVRAKAIVKGRPYKGKDELVAKKIVPQNVYDDIKDQIIAKQK